MEYSRKTRLLAPENTADIGRVVDVANRYPEIDIEALAERFGIAGRTVRKILAAHGITRDESLPKPSDIIDPHPWRPKSLRRRPAMPSISKAEKNALVSDFLARQGVTKIPRGHMTTGNVIFLDQNREF